MHALTPLAHACARSSRARQNEIPDGVLNVVTGFGEEAGAALHVVKLAIERKDDRDLATGFGCTQYPCYYFLPVAEGEETKRYLGDGGGLPRGGAFLRRERTRSARAQATSRASSTS